MKVKRHAKVREKTPQKIHHVLEVQAIPAPTIFWHPSVSLEKLLSDFAEYQDSIIVS